MLNVFRWFCDLSDRRDYERDTESERDPATNRWLTRKVLRPLRIGFPAIEAWQRVNRRTLEQWQLAGITLLDDRFIEVANSPIVLAPTPASIQATHAALTRIARQAKPKRRRPK